MRNRALIKYMAIALVLSLASGCKMFKEPLRVENRNVPASYNASLDTVNSARIVWRNYFTDPNLVSLIDTALKNNQELNITMQEINIARNEVKARQGEYLPFGGLQLGAGPDKAGKHTWDGQSEEAWKASGEKPKYVGDFAISAVFSWELDIWGKLRNAKRAAAARYLGSIEGKNFMVTNLVGEIANSYYELLALDNQLDIINQNIKIQQDALQMTQQLKDNAKESQLAVNRFQAQLLNTQNRQYEIQQQIVETENKINFLTGRFPQRVQRNTASFNTVVFDSIKEGIPAQLLENRPDIRQAERELVASKLDIKAAKAAFFPNIKLSASIGFQAFNPAVWFNPTSLLYSVFGDILAPILNRNANVAAYKSARAKQIQAVYGFEKKVLNAHVEVMNQLSGIEKYTASYNTKASEVDILTQSITVSDNLFKSARADYMEVLLTQREALESRMELIEIKKKQLAAEINVYKALGGGWR
ncbi:MAG TPA: efflux transporter outer membrane subunit [Chitinophagales bacterium]|nr:efflux transporter outer membrane subunit [Chitinophagales bacterium]